MTNRVNPSRPLRARCIHPSANYWFRRARRLANGIWSGESTPHSFNLIFSSPSAALPLPQFPHLASLARPRRGGGVRSNALDSKSSVPSRVPWVRIPPSPPLSLLLQRLPRNHHSQVEKNARFRGVLRDAGRPKRIAETGIRASTRHRWRVFSVGEFGGSLSPSIRASVFTEAHDQRARGEA